MADSYLGDAGDFLLINRFARRTGWLHGFMTGYASTYGLLILVLLLAAGRWLARRAGQLRMMAALIWAGLGTLVAVGVNQPIVTAVAEKRPYISIPRTLLLVSRSVDYGFPSDHAVMAGAVATGLCFVNRCLGIVAWVAAVLLALSRVYVGAHYPHDVAAGLLLGAAVIVLGQLLARPILLWLLGSLVRTPLRPLLVAGRGETRPTSTQGADRPVRPTAPGDPLPAGREGAHRDARD
ncbi:MAG: UDP-diphosphatase [Pseudonocardiales bacterium]|nr:MAG: UDP-diphosphatase [Pseudonocardiales bacterium]